MANHSLRRWARTVPFFAIVIALTISTSTARADSAKPPLRVGFSDWPGWTAFEIGIQKGWFKEAGVDVKFDWFEYAPSMDACTPPARSTPS